MTQLVLFLVDEPPLSLHGYGCIRFLPLCFLAVAIERVGGKLKQYENSLEADLKRQELVHLHG